VEIHVRSVFLQGLLLMTQRPQRFDPWAGLWARWDAWRDAHGGNGIAACLQFVLSVPEVTRIVVGVDSARQLDEIVQATEASGAAWPEDLWSSDATLLNPSLWPR
jgi:aryl-alcohol dehydrogenase-like predicted oxidoreductase